MLDIVVVIPPHYHSPSSTVDCRMSWLCSRAQSCCLLVLQESQTSFLRLGVCSPLSAVSGVGMTDEGRSLTLRWWQEESGKLTLCLPDCMISLTAVWSLRHCAGPQTRLVWLSPTISLPSSQHSSFSFLHFTSPHSQCWVINRILAMLVATEWPCICPHVYYNSPYSAFSHCQLASR